MSDINQEAFDTSIQALLKQNAVSSDPQHEMGNMYNDGRGNKCAIGHILADSEYSRELEGNSIIKLFDKDMLPPSLKKFNKNFLSGLQGVHDMISDYSGEHFRPQLIRNAKEFAIKWMLSVDNIPSE